MIEAAIFVIFPFCMVFAAISDLVSMTIANRVSLLLVAAFALLAPLTGMDWAVYGMHFAAFAAVLCTTFTLFAIGAMGGGDAKLLASTALWMGFSMTLIEYLLISTVIGGALTLAVMAYRNSPLSVFTGHNILLHNLADRKAGIPYGVALGVGGLYIFPQTSLAAWALARVAGI